MRYYVILLSLLSFAGCVGDFVPGQPPCDSRADCSAQNLGPGFEDGLFNCVGGRCIATTCGDGKVQEEEGEVCDDANDEPGDDCNNECQPPTCGDGTIQGSEGCDNGALNSVTLIDGCRLDCRLAFCGDGVQDTGEGCDDGNVEDADGCRNNCTPAVCGDGVARRDTYEGTDANGQTVQVNYEDCDDGNATDDDACHNDCSAAGCGDGLRQGGDGSMTECGDDIGVECDGLQQCIDGLCHGWGEECDDGEANSDTQPDACRSNCLRAYCGDAVLDLSEACDDANQEDGDGCSSACESEPPVCGDGRVQFGEECDDGNGNDADTCRADCTLAFCGDGVLRADVIGGDDHFEECDDGNASDNDECTNQCIFARCGDGVLRSDLAEGVAGYEACDDANFDDDDGCRASCLIAFCGDGVVRRDLAPGEEGFEACDDANENNGDGCMANCLIASCGDGILQEPAEECDDGNEVDEDACTNLCTNARCGDAISRTDIAGGSGNNCGEGLPDCPGGELCLWDFCRPEGYEYCDDGNDFEGDHCTATCTPPPCGDGITFDTEQCDDGNRISWDGCDSNCRDEGFPYCAVVVHAFNPRPEVALTAMAVNDSYVVTGYADGFVVLSNLDSNNSLGTYTVPNGATAPVSITFRPGVEDQLAVVFDDRVVVLRIWSEEHEGHQGHEEHGGLEPVVVWIDDEVRQASGGGFVSRDRIVFDLTTEEEGVQWAVVTLRLVGDAIEQPFGTSFALQEDEEAPVPRFREISEGPGVYLRWEEGEQPTEVLRSYDADHAVLGAMTSLPTVIGTSRADVFAVSREDGATGVHWLRPQEGQEDPDLLMSVRPDVATSGTTSWLGLDDSGEVIARKTDASDLDLWLFNHSEVASTRPIPVAVVEEGEPVPVFVHGAFNTRANQAEFVAAVDDGRIVVISCPVE
jgi:cysteine-rich repeat protein